MWCVRQTYIRKKGQLSEIKDVSDTFKVSASMFDSPFCKWNPWKSSGFITTITHELTTQIVTAVWIDIYWQTFRCSSSMRFPILCKQGLSCLAEHFVNTITRRRLVWRLQFHTSCTCEIGKSVTFGSRSQWQTIRCSSSMPFPKLSSWWQSCLVSHFANIFTGRRLV